MAAEIHVGDVGTTFEATIADEEVPVDLSSAGLLELKFQQPDGVVVTKTALLTTDGTDGKQYYSTEAGFLSLPGLWRWQPYLELPDWQGHGDPLSFWVEDNL